MIPLNPKSQQFTQTTLPHPQIVSRPVDPTYAKDRDDPSLSSSKPDRYQRNQNTAYRAINGAPRSTRNPYPTPASPARTNYPHAPGQLVMGHQDLSYTHMLDQHGNAYHSMNEGTHSQVGPQFSELADHIWRTQAVSRTVRADSIFHTGQPAEATNHGRSPGAENHAYILGKLDQSKPIADVAITGGMPFLADGHHRLAEARGRAEDSVHIRQLDVDAVRANAKSVPKVSNRNRSALETHLIDHHLIHHTELYGADELTHDALHRRLADHVHREPNNQR